jgi:hypothetical protein
MVTYDCVTTVVTLVLREPFMCWYEMWACSCPLKFVFPPCRVRSVSKVKAEKSTHHVSLKQIANRASPYSGLQDVQDRLFLPRTTAGPQSLWPAETLFWQGATLFVLKLCILAYNVLCSSVRTSDPAVFLQSETPKQLYWVFRNSFNVNFDYESRWV